MLWVPLSWNKATNTAGWRDLWHPRAGAIRQGWDRRSTDGGYPLPLRTPILYRIPSPSPPPVMPPDILPDPYAQNFKVVFLKRANVTKFTVFPTLYAYSNIWYQLIVWLYDCTSKLTLQYLINIRIRMVVLSRSIDQSSLPHPNTTEITFTTNIHTVHCNNWGAVVPCALWWSHHSLLVLKYSE